MKHFAAFIVLFFSVCCLSFGNDFKLVSPDSSITLVVNVGEKITWSVFYKKKLILDHCPVSLTIDQNQVLGINTEVINSEIKNIDQTIKPEVPTKKAVVEDKCNELTLQLKENFSLSFRAYNMGVAYRFNTNLKGSVKVTSEGLEINFADDVISYFPEETSYMSHFERSYKKCSIKNLTDKQFCVLPVFFQTPGGLNVIVTEADLYDYPNMFLYGRGKNSLKADFPKYVLDIALPEQAQDRNEIISKNAGYIANVSGTRTFPWRVFYITDRIGEITENDLVYQLSCPLKIENPAWIKPGKVAWDWWNANNIYGVDFKSGLNTETYKYYIDFASKYGLEYIILDEGWSKSTTNVIESRPDININELIEYGKKKNVGIILWLLWKPLDKDMTLILDTYQKWGVKGIKVDFMQRADQYMVKYYERVAAEAAKRKLLVDFHGAFKPIGLNRAYPNVISYEGVKGAEHNKWSKDITPEHNLTLPFTRMVAGPMDYTPGAMDNAQEGDFFARFNRPMSQGTRCHQIAMYIVYESPLQMLADNPSNYYRESECTEFISQIPTTWDDTKVLDAKISDYIIIARRSGNKWFVGAMTDATAREFDIPFTFLSDGNHSVKVMQDGINAYRNGIDYKSDKFNVDNKTIIHIKLAPGGGWAAIITE
jgi:alpha-glucosidase